MNYMLNNVIICPLNRNVRKINDKIVQKLESPYFFCVSSYLTTNDCIYISEEVLDTFQDSPLTCYILKRTCLLWSQKKMDRKKKALQRNKTYSYTGIRIFALYFKPKNTNEQAHCSQITQWMPNRTIQKMPSRNINASTTRQSKMALKLQFWDLDPNTSPFAKI